MKKRNTIQRQLVMSAVCFLRNHPTADQVFEQVVKTYPDISKGTVYRNLNSLVEDGELLRVCNPNGADRFDHTCRPHYHISCIKCGRFYDVDYGYSQNIDEEVSASTGFQVENHDIFFRGVCPDCQKNLQH